jgi:hypothetical protein
MNLPFSSVSTSLSPGTVSYPSGKASCFSMGTGTDGKDFANLLAGAVQPANVQSARHSSNMNRASGDRHPQSQKSAEADRKETESARRNRLKKDRDEKTDNSPQSDQGSIPNPPSAVGATPLTAATDSSSATQECDETGPAESVVNSSQQLSPFPGDSQVTPGTGSTDPAAPDSTDSPASPSTALSAMSADSTQETTAVDGFVLPDETPPSNTKSATTAKAGPADLHTSPTSRHPTDSAVSGLSSNNDNLPAKTAATASAPGKTSPLDLAEKIAPSLGSTAPEQANSAVISPIDAASDTTLAADYHSVDQTPISVGIASAQSKSDMSKQAATSTLVPSDRTAGVDVSANVLIPSTSGSAAASAPATHATDASTSSSLSHAAAAVEATLDSVEHMRDAARTSVELNLSFGNDDRLAVRVELRNGEVQTTFRTDSTELRQALSNEWHQQAPTVTADTSDRPLHIADPVFVADSGSQQFSGTSTGGQTDSRQTPTFSPEKSFLPSSPQPQSQASSAPSSPSSSLRLPTSLRLNVFA